MMGGDGPFHGGGPNSSPMGGALSHGPMSASSIGRGGGMRGPRPLGGAMGGRWEDTGKPPFLTLSVSETYTVSTMVSNG